jgi:hypothetical protein
MWALRQEPDLLFMTSYTDIGTHIAVLVRSTADAGKGKQEHHERQ